MTLQMTGVIKGKTIELDNSTGLLDGTTVTVNIDVTPFSLDEQLQLIDELCGAWADDKTIPAIFANIEKNRLLTASRPVVFDDTP